MLVTDVKYEMCWRQLCGVGDGFGRFRHQDPVSFSAGANIPKIVTYVEPPTSNCHQHLFNQ